MKTKKLYVGVGLGLAQLALLNSFAAAQEKPVGLLDEVVVTASRSPKKLSEIGKVVRIISAETLAKSQGRSLPEVLNNVAGLTIGGNGNNPGDIKSVYLRGASAGNTLILIDGIPVNDASEISGEYNISAISIDLIERIEILKGGNSTLYGSDAVAGLINIITKKGSGGISADLLATAGSYDSYKQVLSLQGQIGQTSLSFSGSNFDSENFSTALPGRGETDFDKDDFHQKSVLFNLAQKVSEKVTLRGNFQANNNNAGIDNGAFADAKDYRYSKSSFLAGMGGKIVLNRGILNFNLSQNNLQNYYNNRGSLTSNGGNITHLESNLNYALNNFVDLASGISYRYSETDQNNPFSAALKADNNIKSVFTSVFLKSNSGFHFEIGGRLNNHSEYGNNFTYTLNPSWLITDRYKVFANLSSAYRIPSLYQLFSQYGNLNLEPETATSYEAGFDLVFSDKINLSAALFRRDIENVIDFGQITTGKFGYINQNRQNDRGLEIELNLKPHSAISLNAFYAFVEGEVTTPVNTSFNLFRRPKNSFGLNAGLDLNHALSMNIIYKYTGDRSDRYFNSSNFKVEEAELGSYGLIDAYVQYKPAKRLTLFTDIRNILDENYTEFAGYQTKGLNFSAGFKLAVN